MPCRDAFHKIFALGLLIFSDIGGKRGEESGKPIYMDENEIFLKTEIIIVC